MQKPSPAPTDCIENGHIDIAPLYLHAKCKYNVDEPFLNHPCLFRSMLTLFARCFLSHSRTVCGAPSFAAVVFCWFSSSHSRAEICLGTHFLFLCEWSWAGRKQGQLRVPLLSRRPLVALFPCELTAAQCFAKGQMEEAGYHLSLCIPLPPPCCC